MPDNKTARDYFKEAYKTEEPQKQTEQPIELNEADLEKASVHRLMAWGYKKLLEQDSQDE
jgi:hypothetical protein